MKALIHFWRWRSYPHDMVVNPPVVMCGAAVVPRGHETSARWRRVTCPACIALKEARK